MLVGVHAACYRQNLSDWLHGDSPERNDESAFHTLAHAGYLFRYTGRSVISSESLDPETSIRILRDGCRHAMTHDFAEDARYHLEHGLGEDSLEEDSPLVLLVQERDFMEAFLEESARLSHPLVQAGGKDLHIILSNVGVKTLEFDQLIDEEYPQLAIELSKTMEHLMKGFAVLPSRSRCWWFYRWRESRAELDERTSSIKVGTEFRKNVTTIIAKLFSGSWKIEFPRVGISVERLPLPLAAADNEQDFSTVIFWKGSSFSMRFPLSGASFMEGGKETSVVVARLHTAIGLDEGQVSGQWYLEGETTNLVPDSVFYVIEKESGRISGRGKLGTENPAIATLVEGDWSILRKHSPSVSGLALLIPV